MSNYVDLHCHYLPGIDDGVNTLDEGLQVVTGLHKLGFSRVIATPHIRTAMFENRKPGLEAAFDEFESIAADVPGLPQLGLAAEHYCDDVFWSLYQEGQAVPYPGGNAALVEFHYEIWPQRISDIFFEMNVGGVRPVLAHPERYAGLARDSARIDPLLDVGAVPLLDLMSLVGHYGQRSQRAAERMLDEGVYWAACTDTHRPGDLPRVAEAIAQLTSLVGSEEASELLAINPQLVLEGRLST